MKRTSSSSWAPRMVSRPREPWDEPVAEPVPADDAACDPAPVGDPAASAMVADAAPQVTVPGADAGAVAGVAVATHSPRGRWMMNLPAGPGTPSRRPFRP